MTKAELLSALKRLDACGDAVAWVRSSRKRTAASLWNTCPRGDWMLWLAACAGVDRRVIVLAACDAVETALVHVPPEEERPRRAIETARAWARGEASLEEVRLAARSAYAAGAAYAAHAAHAAAGSAYAAGAAYAAHADYAAYAAYVAAGSASAASDASLARSADLVRARIPRAVVEEALS